MCSARILKGPWTCFDITRIPMSEGNSRLASQANFCRFSKTTETSCPISTFTCSRAYFESTCSLESLPFLEEEKPNVLIDEFSHFYIDRICLFKNSEHVLDTEETVKARLKGQAFVDGERVLQNYRFVDSQNDPGVQISDVVVGLIGKCFGYLIRTEQPELLAARAGFSPAQRASLDKLARLLDRSTDENPAFAHYTLSLEDRERAAMFLGP